MILTDGRPIYEPYFGSLDLGQLLLDDIETVKVVKGPASSLYGPNAMGGVINIITRRITAGSSWGCSVEGGNERYQHLGLNHGRRIGPVDYRITLTCNVAGGYPLSRQFQQTDLEVGSTRSNSDFENVLLSGRLGLLIKEKTQINLSIGKYWTDKGIPPSTLNRPRYWRFRNWNRAYVDLTSQTQVTTRLSLKGKVYQARFDNILDAYTNADYESIKWVSTYHNRVSGAMLIWNYRSRYFVLAST